MSRLDLRGQRGDDTVLIQNWKKTTSPVSGVFSQRNVPDRELSMSTGNSFPFRPRFPRGTTGRYTDMAISEPAGL